MPHYIAPSTSTGALTRLPHEQRQWPLQYVNDDETVGGLAFPINYDELYNLKGRLLTLIDATYTDPEQRKAQKDIVWQTLKAWMEDIAARGYTSVDLPDASSSTLTHAQAGASS